MLSCSLTNAAPSSSTVENSDPSFQPLDLTFAFLLRFIHLIFQDFADFNQFVLHLQNFGFQCFDLSFAGRNDLITLRLIVCKQVLIRLQTSLKFSFIFNAAPSTCLSSTAARASNCSI